MGGPQRLAKQHSAGKLDARARLAHLLDPGSFHELGTMVGGEIAADGIVVGSGSVNGSPVMVGAEDFTTLAGSIGPGGNAKRYRGIPVVGAHQQVTVALQVGGHARDGLFQPQRLGQVVADGGQTRPHPHGIGVAAGPLAAVAIRIRVVTAHAAPDSDDASLRFQRSEMNAVPNPNCSPWRASSVSVAGPLPPAPASR
jgi:hypothetical protein